MTVPVVSFFVAGHPQPGGSKRGFAIRQPGGRVRVAIVEDAKRNKPWRSSVAMVASQAMTGSPLAGPISVDVVFRVARPKGHFGSGRNAGTVRPSAPMHPTTKPDATKLWRAAEDALTGIVWRDDAQIVRQTVEKRYADAGPPGVFVRVWSLDRPDA